MKNRTRAPTAAALLGAVVCLCGGPAAAQPAPPTLPYVVTGVDIDGYWTDLFHEDLWDRRSGLMVGDFTGLPLSEAGRLAAMSWDPGWFAIPEEQCRPHTGIYGLRGPTGLQIAKVMDPNTRETVRYDVLLGLSERTVWMDGRPHPPPHAPHTFAGFSTGQWEGPLLKVTTTHVKAGYLQRNGPPHSDQALTTEWFVRQGDTLMLISIIEDPGYLSEPLVRTTNWALDKRAQRPGRGQVDCSPFEIVDERVGQPKHFVPHYLPDAYDVHREFQALYGIPQEGAFGGAPTLYPEYMPRLEALRDEFLAELAAERLRSGLSIPQEEFLGSWRLDRSRSTFEVSWRRAGLDGRDGSAPERREMRLVQTPDGAITHTIDTQIVANDTGFHRVEYSFRFDGGDYPARGGAVETFSLRRTDEKTVERIGKIDGDTVETAVWRLSADDKMLTVTTEGDIDGNTYRNTQVFERTEN